MNNRIFCFIENDSVNYMRSSHDTDMYASYEHNIMQIRIIVIYREYKDSARILRFNLKILRFNLTYPPVQSAFFSRLFI